MVRNTVDGAFLLEIIEWVGRWVVVLAEIFFKPEQCNNILLFCSFVVQFFPQLFSRQRPFLPVTLSEMKLQVEKKKRQESEKMHQ